MLEHRSMRLGSILDDLMRLGARIPPPKQKDDIGLKKFLHFFNGVYTKDDVQHCEPTHVCMTGGTWIFPSIGAIEPECTITPTEAFTDRWRTLSVTDCWFKPRSEQSHHQMTELEYAYLFYKKAPGIIGRKATYEELFWAAFETWTKRMETYTRPENQGNYNVCITECRSAPLFRMYVAFQFIEPRRMQNDEWKSFLGEVCEIAARGVAGCYEAIPRKSTIFNVTVLQTNDFVEHVGGVERGVHLVWPNLIVDESTALRLVTTIELMLTASGPCRVDGQNTYEDAVDTTVYRFGLRLPGCPKSELCSICGGNRSQMSKSIRRPNDEYESYANRLARFCPDHRKFPVGYGFRRETAYGIKDIVDGTGISLPQPEWERLTGSAYIYRDKSHNTRVFNFTIKELASIRTTATEATPGFKARGDIERLLKNLDENDIRICSRYDLKTDTKCKSPRGVKRKLLVGKRLTLTV